MHPESIFNPDRPSSGLTRQQLLARPALGLQHEAGQSVARMWEVVVDQRHAAWLKKQGVTERKREPVILERSHEVTEYPGARSLATMIRNAHEGGWRTKVTRAVLLRPAGDGWTYIESLVARIQLGAVRCWAAWERADVHTAPRASYSFDDAQVLHLPGWPVKVNATALADVIAAGGDEAGIMQLRAVREQRAAEAKLKRETSK